MTRSLRGPFATSFVALAALCLVACPKKQPPPPVGFDAGPPVAPTASETDLQPLGVEDAGIDAAVVAVKKPVWHGTTGNSNVTRFKQCCTALGAQAKTMGNSPEVGYVQAAAAQCNVVAAQLGPNSNAPELGAIRTALQGKNIPPVCAGF